MKIDKTLQLPCGVEIKNRFLKSAMTEGIANIDASANNRHVKLYERWSRSYDLRPITSQAPLLSALFIPSAVRKPPVTARGIDRNFLISSAYFKK